MSMEHAWLIFEDMFFSFLAAFGFGSISNPPFKALLAAGFLGAFGHGLRYFLMNVCLLHIVPASFLAAFCLSFCGFLHCQKMHILLEVFTFPAILPMIPGIPAYNTIISLVKFLNAKQGTGHVFLEQVFYNGFSALFILSALVLGILFPYLLMSEKCWAISRQACRKK